MIVFRIRYTSALTIPHVYCRVFVAKDGGTFALTGNLTMRRDDFAAFREKFDAEFILEDLT